MKKTLLTVFGIVAIAYFSPLVFNQSLLVYWGDELEQLIPHMRQFVLWIQNWDFNFWNPSIGLGSNTFVGFFISLGSPFTWIAALFPIEWLPYLFIYFDMIRFMVTAYFAYRWLSQIVEDENARMVGTLIITFSGYMMCWIHYGPFIDPFMGFAMILYFAEKMLKDSNKLLFALSIAFTFLLNPYYFYMFAWFLIAYLAFRVWTENKDWKHFFNRVVYYASYFLLGIGLIAVIVIPVVLILRTTPRVSTLVPLDFLPTFDIRTIYAIITSFFSPVMNDFDYNLFYSYFSTPPQMSQPYIFSFVIFVFLLYPFTRIRFENKYRWVFFVTVFYLMMFIPGFYKILNGNTDSRWMFIIVLVNAIVAAKTINHLNQLKWFDWFINLGILCLLIGSFYMISGRNLLYTLQNQMSLKQHLVYFVGIVFAYSIVFNLKSKKNQTIALILVLMIEGVYVLNRRMTINGSQNYINSDYQINDLFYNPSIDVIKEMDKGFYRIDVQDGITTNPATLNYPGFLMYMSVYNHDSQAYYDNRFMPFRKLEYAPSKTLAKTILGSKYWVPHDGTLPFGYTWFNDKFAINQVDVGLGFASSQRIYEASLISESTFIQDLAMFSGVIDVNGTSTFTGFMPTQIINDGKNESYDISSLDDGYFLIDYSRANPFGTCTIDFTEDGNVVNRVVTTEYGYTSAPMFRDAKKVYFYCSNMYYLEEHLPVDVYFITEEDVEVLYKQLNSFDFFENVENSTDTIKADLQVRNDESVVFTNLPYDKGWKVFVDGEEVLTRPVNIAFVGFDVSSGAHQVEFRYTPPGLLLGSSISGLSLLIILVLAYNEKKKRKA